jgi:hypothetical protein
MGASALMPTQVVAFNVLGPAAFLEVHFVLFLDGNGNVNLAGDKCTQHLGFMNFVRIPSVPTRNNRVNAVLTSVFYHRRLGFAHQSLWKKE